MRTFLYHFGSTTPHLLKFHVIFLYCSNLFNLPFTLFFSKGILYFLLKSNTVVYFLFFRFNNNIPYFTNIHIYMFQFNFLISLLKCGFFLCFKSSALGIFFENNSICSARFFIGRSHKCMNNILNRFLFFFCYLYLFLSF